MLFKVIIREGGVRLYSGSQMGVIGSMNVYVPHWQDIKTFRSWLLKEIIVAECKICTDSHLHSIGSESVQRTEHSNFKIPNENRMLRVGYIRVFTEELNIFQNIPYQELGSLVRTPYLVPPIKDYQGTTNRVQFLIVIFLSNSSQTKKYNYWNIQAFIPISM